MKSIRWRFVGLVLAACFLAIALPVLAMLHFDPLCGEELANEQMSPDRRYVAASFVRNCGATTDFVTHVNFRPVAAKFSPDFFGGTIDEGEIAGIDHQDGGVIFCCIDTGTLNIEFPLPQREEWAKHKWRDVSVTYAKACP